MDSLQCVVERITFQNPENGYSVLKVNSKGYNEPLTAVGYLVPSIGSVLKLYGEWKINSKYGKQFNVSKYEEKMPSSIYGIEKYLGSGLIKGIGPAYAKNIVNIFKEDTFQIIENNPEKLIEINGIGKKTIEKIKKSWQEQKEIKNIILFLQQYNVSISYAVKIFKTYGSKSIEIIKENPYKLADDIWGIGFKTADSIAEKLGIDNESYIRCRSGVLYTLNELANQGHCYAGFEQLIQVAINLLNVDKNKIIMTVSDMRHNKDIICENSEMDKIYLPSFFYSETGVSKLIKNILDSPRLKNVKEVHFSKNSKYDELQKDSIKCAVNSKFMILTGGPGTGKTTTMSGIIEVFKNNNFNVILAAPTGRAAKRMTEATGIEAKTIHRLLEAKPPNGYNKNEKNLLEGNILIIDESSMIDIILMYNLLKAVPPSMSVILIGDTDQLPSVGAGNVFKDIIESGIVSVVKLEKIYRQAGNSDIIKNAHKINKGEYLNLKNSKTSDFFFIEQADNSLIPEIISKLCKERLPEKYNINPISDIQVLCPMQKGDTGTINLNNVLQRSLNTSDLFVKYGGIEFHLNDKVMQIKNNYDKEVFNGDIGIINKIDLENSIIGVNFDRKQIEYETTELDELVLSYAITIHKSQGSEYPVVIMPITMSHFIMLQRNLIYTGITRAKKLIVLIGDKKALYYGVKNDKVIQRNTYLNNRLKYL